MHAESGGGRQLLSSVPNPSSKLSFAISNPRPYSSAPLSSLEMPHQSIWPRRLLSYRQHHPAISATVHIKQFPSAALLQHYNPTTRNSRWLGAYPQLSKRPTRRHRSTTFAIRNLAAGQEVGRAMRDLHMATRPVVPFCG